MRIRPPLRSHTFADWCWRGCAPGLTRHVRDLKRVALVSMAGAALTYAGASCSELKNAGPTQDGGDNGVNEGSASVDGSSADGSVTSDGSTALGDGGSASATDSATPSDGAATGPNGPGPHGSLPTGYCCTSNDECRYRKCVAVNGVRMCADACEQDPTCNALPGFTCVGASPSAPGHCAPTSTATTCRPSSQFVRGSKQIGACCTPQNDGLRGLDCEGSHCESTGDDTNPFHCVRACNFELDCPGNYYCSPSGFGYGICSIIGATYTCDK